jgi:hypothetical protein
VVFRVASKSGKQDEANLPNHRTAFR